MMSEVKLGGQHGTKRPPEDDLEAEQPLTKRFDNLQLNHYHGTTSQQASTAARSQTNDHMYLDDTKDKVYIHDLDAELAEIEDEKPHIEFLPDIEKKLAAFPSLLESRPLSPSQSQMVLYRPISFPEEVRNIRKAIIESRRKARMTELPRNAKHPQEQQDLTPIGEIHVAERSQSPQPYDDPDAMDIG